MNKTKIFILLFFINNTIANDNFYEFQNQDGSVNIYRNNEKLELPENNTLIAESSEAKSIDLNNDGIPEVALEFHNNTKNTPLVTFLYYDKKDKSLKEIKSKNTLHAVSILGGQYITSSFTYNYRYDEILKYDDINNYFKSLFKDEHFDDYVIRHYPNGTQSYLDNDKNPLKRQPIIGLVGAKSYLHNTTKSSSITNMYLIKDDKVVILNEEWDEKDKKWYFIKYNGKKMIYSWIKGSNITIKKNHH